MKQKLKIMFSIHGLCKGGAERVISNLSNYFCNEYEVSLLAINAFDDEKNYDLDKRVKYIKCGNSWYKNTKNLFMKFKNLFFNLKKIKKNLKSENPDVIVVFLPRSAFKILLVKPKNTKVIYSGRNDPEKLYDSKIKKLLVKILFKRIDGFIYQTEDEKKWYEKRFKKEGKVILNSLNPSFVVDKPYTKQRKKEIVSMGRLSEQKNFPLLINAFKIVSEKHPDYKLTIYGEGELKNNLLEQAKNLNLEKKVSFPGIIDDVKSAIYDATVFVLPSNFEGMPNALIEAMVLGLPVIATDCPCGGPKTLIDNNKNGILININDQEALAKGINKIIEDSNFSKTIGDNASKLINLVNPDVVNKEWEDFILKTYNKR